MNTAMDKNKRRFLQLRHKISDDISHLEKLSELVEDALTNECAALAEEMKAQKAKLSKKEGEYLEGWHKIDFLRLQEDFPRLQRYAMFTTAMAAVEANVIALCNVLKDNMGLSKFNKPQNNIVNAALKYLEKQANIKMAHLCNDIKVIDMFRRIRNCIVHSEGINTDPKPQEIVNYCNKIPTLFIDKQNRIVLYKNFVSFALNTIRRFFYGLLEKSGNI